MHRLSLQQWRKAVETAYKAVMKPKEGTILTVAREAAAKAAEIAETAEDLDTFFQDVIAHAEADSGEDSGNASGSERGRSSRFRRTGSSGSTDHGAYDGFLGKEVDYTQFDKAEGSVQ